MTIHIANQERADAAGTHARVVARLLAAACAASAFAFTLFPVALFPLAPAFSLPEKAQASGVWPLPSPRLSVDLGFLENYEFSGASYTHRGVDIAADAGARICSPVDGTVAFVGDVPAGDVGTDGGGAGATMRAVSVKMDDGRSVTFMPVQDAHVEEGEGVSAGQELAFLAASGDRSSATPHLHMGLKRGDSYYDPLALFGLEGTASAAARADDAGAQAETAATGATTAQAAAGGTSLAAEGAAGAAQGSALAEGAGVQGSGAGTGNAQEELSAQDSAAGDFGTISSGDAAGALSGAGAADASPLQAVRSFFSPAAEACGSQLEGLRGALADLGAVPWLAAIACIGGVAGVAGIAGVARSGCCAKRAQRRLDAFHRHFEHLISRARSRRARLAACMRAAVSHLRGIYASCTPERMLRRLSSQRRESSSCERESGVVG